MSESKSVTKGINSSGSNQVGNSSLIVKSNYLVNARYSYTPLEMKIIYLMARQIKPGDDAFQTYHLSIREFQRDCNLSGNSLHEYMVKVIKRLMGKVIEVRDENNNVELFPLVTYSKHRAKEGTINLTFVPQMQPHLLDLKERFTSFYDANVLALNSQYSMRIYELLKQYEVIGKRKITVEKLRHMLMLEDKYGSYNLFKRKVIEKARNDLDKHCDISFTYQEFKTGRKITSIEFRIHRVRVKSDTPKIAEQEDNTIEAALANMGITKGQIKKYLKDEQRDEKQLWSLIEETKRRFEMGKVKNPTAYLVRLIENDANVKSSFVQQEEVKKEKVIQTPIVKKAALQKETKLIESLQAAFIEVRKQYLKEIIGEFSPKDWEDFELMIGDSKYATFARKIKKNGKLDKIAAEGSLLMTFFLDNRIRSEHEHFMDWAYRQHGYQLEKQGDAYRIVGSQKSLF